MDGEEHSRQKEQSLMASIPGGVAIYRMKKDGRVIAEYVSEGLAKMCGYEVIDEFLEYLSDNAMVNVAQEDMNAVLHAAERSLSTKQPLSVIYHIHVKNQPDILNCLDANIMEGELGEDDLAVWHAVHTKVSEESKKIIQDQKRLSELIDEVPAGIGIYEVRGESLSQTYVNEAFYDMLGTKREERNKYLGDNTIKAVHPDDVQLIKAAIGKLMAGDTKTSVTYRVRSANDDWFWLNLTGTVVQREENYLKVYTAFSDYNTIMQAQHELESERITSNVALEAAKILTWKYDYKQKQIIDSGTLGTAFGLPKVVDDVPQAILDMGFVEEQSVEDFRALFRQVETEKTASADIMSTVSSEYGPAWYRLIYTPTFDKYGNYAETIGIAIDITDQKVREHTYEEQLRLKKASAQGALATASYNLTQNTIIESESPHPELRKIMDKATADEVLSSIRQAIPEEKERERFNQAYDCRTLLERFREGTKHIEIRHHLQERTGWLQSSYDMITNPYTGDVEAISLLEDVTEMVRAELVINRLLAVDYQAIMTIDVKTGRVTSFRKERIDQNLSELMELQEKLGDGEAALEAHLRKYGAPENIEKAIADNNLSNVTKQLERTPYYETMYTICRDGKMLHQRAIYAYLEDGRDVIVCAVQDITETMEQEERQKRELSIALKEAQKANEAKTAFLSRVSHDMRTPLNGILGLTALIRENVTDDKINRDLTELEMSGQYLLNLINDTLDVSRIESGKLELHPSVCDGKTLFNNALGLGKTSIQEKHIQFSIHAENLPFTTLYVDVDRIQQVVMNILGNAVKFTPEGGKIDVFMRNLSVEDGVITDELIIQDNGVGMSEEFIPHIFEAFSQEDVTRTTSHQGTGLGMSITKEILQIMGGDIAIESEQGKGTRVIITIPLQIATEQQVAEWKASKVREIDDTVLSERRILLCEDHPLNATIATRLLESKGMKVEHAENGAVGVRMFDKSDYDYYDAVLMDIRMPVMDGIDAAREIRSLPRRDARFVPIIAMTANAFEEDVKQTKDAGMDAHLSKPIQKDILYDTLESLLRVDHHARRQKILIVDDVETNRAVVRASLEQDYEIIEAADGCEALEKLEKDRGVDVIITDIQMPNMDGVELIKQVRAQKLYRHVAIITNTQYGDPEQEEQLLALGADDFVYKPTTPKIVEIRVRNVLRRV